MKEMINNRMTAYADCGDIPDCGPPCGTRIGSRVARPRPDRAALLTLVAKKGRARTKDLAICQADCAHCYAGHCGTGIGDNRDRRI